MGSSISYEQVRKSEARLLADLAQHLNEPSQEQILRRDVVVKVKDDPVVTEAVLHFIELRPKQLGIFRGGTKGSLSPGASMRVESADEGSTQSESENLPPLVFLPGFGMGAAAFAPCLQQLLEVFPDRRIFLLDWPASGGGPRMPWTPEDAAKRPSSSSSRRKSEVSATSPVHNGYLSEASTSKAAAGEGSFPLPERRFAALIEAWRLRLGLKKFILVGHSLGGFIAFTYAELHPDGIEQLVLCSPCGVPHRPDAYGISREEYMEWYRRRAREDPESASEFSKGSAIKRPRLTCGEWSALVALGFIGIVAFPITIAVVVVIWLRLRVCPQRPKLYRTMYPSHGMAPDFLASWSPMTGLAAEDTFALYDRCASPPQTLLHSLPHFAVRRIMHHFAEMRFADNGQWIESEVSQPTGSLCEVVTGHELVSAKAAAMMAKPTSQIKISRQRFSEYQCDATIFGPMQWNWGEQLFACIQLWFSYGSGGWMRRPIGRRIERFIGIPHEDGVQTEFYTDPSQHGIDVGKGNQSPGPTKVYMLTETDPEQPKASTEHVPICFIYGKADWMDFRAAKLIAEKASRHCGRTIPVLRVNDAGHQLFVDNPQGFVQAVRMAVR
mmetsp:Transcript_34275/g.80107  ORF Transcript_34275/g.80107 Transcript_34275/m.80107 type:complete len:611 (-) Transcript_34275:30-1862(-)